VAGRAIAEVPLESFNESTNIMVHAWPGQGKTRWAIGAPNCVLVSSEPGAISAKRHARVLRRTDVGLVKLASWADAVSFRRQLEAQDFDHRSWVIIDTISTLQQKNQNEVLDKAVADNPRRDPDIPAVQDYLKQQNSLKRWVEFVVDYPINTIWLAHTMRVEDRDGGAMMLPTILGGQDKGFPIANYVMGLMNCVGYMEMRQVKGEGGKKMVRRILWQPYHDVDKDIRYVAKDHFAALGTWTDDMEFPEHLALIEGSDTQEPGQPVKKAARRVARPAA
jgi:hypothetical protein